MIYWTVALIRCDGAENRNVKASSSSRDHTHITESDPLFALEHGTRRARLCVCVCLRMISAVLLSNQQLLIHLTEPINKAGRFAGRLQVKQPRESRGEKRSTPAPEPVAAAAAMR